MPRARPKTAVCQVCKQTFPLRDAVPADLVRTGTLDVILKQHPDWSPEGFICHQDLNRFRATYVQDVLQVERGELSKLEEDVLRSLREQELLSRNLNLEYVRGATRGERIADRMAEMGGSWRFIACFVAFLGIWIAVNSVLLIRRPFDPYPFILLNLILSCVAALQAPVIMMSQRRQEMRDRLRAEEDYRVNLKAELEVRHLAAKIDQLLTHQWQRLLEIQEIQLELLGELEPRRRRSNDT